MEKHKSLFNNYIFNMLKTCSSILFPIITFTYSARVLGVNGVGEVNFAKSIISYFIMLAMLGMNYYGTREAAKRRDDRDALSKYCHEMLIINGITTIMTYALLAISMATIVKLHDYETLLLVNSIAIVLQGMGMEWLYQAVEEYRYIAVRTMVFQLIALIAMFIFVRDADDVIWYAIVSLCATSGSYILNFINARRYISFRKYEHYKIVRHLKPLLWLFAMAVSIELYTVLDTTMLGFLQGDTAVGKYTAAIKVNKMVNTMIMAIGVVLIPRLSYHIGQGEKEKVAKLVDKAYNYTFMLSVPCAVGLYMLSDEIILMFCGSEFSSAAFTMRIMTPIVILIPFSVATNQQTFVPMGKEKLILISTAVGAVTNFTCNMLLIPRYAENGAAIGTVVAESAVAVVCLINANKYFDTKKILSKFYQYWIASIPVPVVAILLKLLSIHYVIRTGSVMVVSAICYFVILCLLRNRYIAEVIYVIKNKVKRRIV